MHIGIIGAPSIAFFAMGGIDEAHAGLPLQHEVGAPEPAPSEVEGSRV